MSCKNSLKILFGIFLFSVLLFVTFSQESKLIITIDFGKDKASKRLLGIGIDNNLPEKWWIKKECKKINLEKEKCIIDENSSCIVLISNPRKYVGKTIECEVKREIKSLELATSSTYKWQVSINYSGKTFECKDLDKRNKCSIKI